MVPLADTKPMLVSVYLYCSEVLTSIMNDFNLFFSFMSLVNVPHLFHKVLSIKNQNWIHENDSSLRKVQISIISNILITKNLVVIAPQSRIPRSTLTSPWKPQILQEIGYIKSSHDLSIGWPPVSPFARQSRKLTSNPASRILHEMSRKFLFAIYSTILNFKFCSVFMLIVLPNISFLSFYSQNTI
jgi:hypothetical protein